MKPKMSSPFHFMALKTVCSLTLFLIFGVFSLPAEVKNVSNSPGVKSFYPRMATDPSGTIHVVWVEKNSDPTGDLFYTQSMTNGASWTTPLNLSNSSSVFADTERACDICADSAGNIYVAWVEDDKIYLRTSSGGTWSAPTLIDSGEPLDTVSIASGKPGNIYMIWWALSGTVWSRARVDGTMEGFHRLSRGGLRSKFPRIAVGNDAVYACWSEKNNPLDIYETVYSSRSTALNSSWTAVDKVYETGESQSHPDVEVDSMDNPHFIWSDYISGNRVVRYTTWTGSAFTAPVDISSTILLHYPSIYEQNNVLYVCWQVGGYENGTTIQYNVHDGSGWSGVTNISQSAGSTFADVSASSDGKNAHFTWDSFGEIKFTSLEVIVTPNELPVADFTFSPETGGFPLEVTFDASLSYDPDGQIDRYEWDFGDGSTGEGITMTHTYQNAGTYTIDLLVVDNNGAGARAQKTIEVLEISNEPPVADFTYSPQTGLYPLQVSFDASSSYDPDGEISRYSWDFGNDSTASGPQVTHTFSPWGNYSVTLEVEDDMGETASKTVEITVLRLFQPLNIRWEIIHDDSLFLRRFLVRISWEKNPLNDQVAAVASYRIYRKNAGESDVSYVRIGEVASSEYQYFDKNVGKNSQYVYTVTSVDSQGHESPIDGQTLSRGSKASVRRHR